MKQIENMNLEQCRELLKNVQSYANMTKKIGKRGRELFVKTLLGTKSYTVEYFPALGESSAWKQAENVFLKSFSLSPKKEEVKFTPNKEIKGGMKVYVDDNMIDLSYKKVETLLQK